MFENYISLARERIEAFDNEYTNQIRGMWTHVNEMIDSSKNPNAMRNAMLSIGQFTSVAEKFETFNNLRTSITNAFNNLENTLSEDWEEVSQAITEMDTALDRAMEEAQSILTDIGG